MVVIEVLWIDNVLDYGGSEVIFIDSIQYLLSLLWGQKVDIDDIEQYEMMFLDFKKYFFN